MTKFKKKYFRKRFTYLKDMPYYLLLDASSLTPNIIAKKIKEANIRRCRSALPYLERQDLAGGCLRFKLFPFSIAELEISLKSLLPEILCLGLCAKGKWYPVPLLLKSLTENKNFKILTLIIAKGNNHWIF